MNASDAALGFQPSHAPPLDPMLAQQVSSPGRARGRQVAAIAPAAIPPAVTAPGGPATAVVIFGKDTTVLNDEARGQVKSAAEAFRAKGGAGYIRVVGHSSAGGKLSAERKMVIDVERSQTRANAVARELIKDGVPAAKVLVEAVGDTRSGPEGERRADIFVQS
jgi:outer membrane protein OmpA-like peptidoglycan-associated protein